MSNLEKKTTPSVRTPNLIVWAPVSESGPGVFFVNLLRILAEHGINVKVVTHSRVGNTCGANLARCEIVEVHSVLEYVRECWQLCRTRGVVFAFHMGVTPPAFACLSRILGIPTIPIIVGSDWFDDLRPKLLSGPLFTRARARWNDMRYKFVCRGKSIVASSIDIVEFLQTVYHIRSESTIVVPTALVDFELFREKSSGPDSQLSGEHTIVFVGRLAAENNLEALIRAMKGVVRSAPNVKLLIVGEGPLHDDLQRLATSLGIEGCVRFLGYVAHDSIPKVIESATLAVFPFSWGAGVGNAVFEAMRTGLPVIMTPINKTASELAANGGIYLVAKGDDTTLTEAILTLLNDPDLRTRIRLAAQDYVRRSLSPPAIAATWRLLLGKVGAV
jgi:glycosyltransferase involved in cell wall biosynthesis